MSPDPHATELEAKKFDLDAEIRRREISIKEAEAKRAGLTTAQASVAGAVIALLSGVCGAIIAAWSTQNVESGKSLTSLQIEELKAKGNLDLEKSRQLATEALERKKFETSLILDAIKTPSRADAIRNLKFFVAAGFVSDPEGRIGKLSDASLPSIGTPSAESATRAISSTGIVEVSGAFRCTAALISPRHVITAGVCVSSQSDREKDVTLELAFKIGEQKYPLKRIEQFKVLKLALLEIAGGRGASMYLNRSRIRAPLIGERVYLAIQSPNQSVELRTCEVVEGQSTSEDFGHNCTTGPGSAGAIVIAVSDDALLGVHHSAIAGRNFGMATRLTTALAQLTPFIESASAP